MRGSCAVLLVLAIGLPTSLASAATLRVPSEYPTIQSAISASAAWDTVLVAPGEYLESLVLLPSRTLMSEAGAGTTVLRPPAAARAIDLQGDDTYTEIRGFTIRDGVVAGNGAGIRQVGGWLTLADCLFLDNHADQRGGAIYVEAGYLLASGCQFEGNGAAEGGAICGLYLGGSIAASILRSNTATGNGGALFAYQSSLIIEGCEFSSNDSGQKGGAVWIATYSTVTITDNLLRLNHAAEGGALHVGRWCGGELLRNRVYDNMATSNGGGLALDDCLYLGAIQFNEIVRNVAGALGGGIWMHGSQHTAIENNTLVSNRAEEGGGIYAVGTTGINRNIVASNEGYGLVLDPTPGIAHPASECNDVWENVPGDYLRFEPAGNDISVNPRFCNPAGDDYTIDSWSHCTSARSPCAALIGALDAACGPTAAIPSTWGRLKERYR